MRVQFANKINQTQASVVTYHFLTIRTTNPPRTIITTQLVQYFIFYSLAFLLFFSCQYSRVSVLVR